jgi:hypothetical protein
VSKSAKVVLGLVPINRGRAQAIFFRRRHQARKATARQDQGPEVVFTSVIASIIRAIAIMTNAVEKNRILGFPPKLVCDTSLSPELFGELFLPICI